MHVYKRGVSGRVPHKSFTTITRLIFTTIGRDQRGSIVSPSNIRRFLSRITVCSLRTGASSHASFCITFCDVRTPLMNFYIHSHLKAVFPLLSKKHATGLGFRRANIGFTAPAMGGVGTFNRRSSITKHVLVVRHLKKVLGCGSITSGMFHDGLYVVSLRFPHVLNRVLHIVRLSNVSGIDSLARTVGRVGPLGVGSRLVRGRDCCRCGVGRFLVTLTLKVHPTGVFGKVSSTVSNFLFMGNGKRMLYCRGTSHRIFTSFLFIGSQFRGDSARGSGCKCLRHRGKICCFGLGLGVNLLGE